MTASRSTLLHRQALHDLKLNLLDFGEPLPLPIDQVIDLLMEMPDFEFSLEVDPEIVFRPQPILRLLALLAHHDDRRLEREETVARDIEAAWDDNRTFGEKAADMVADFGGSWNFIGLFFVVLVVWMGFNIWAATRAVFDPYPFILLNLVLSCIAAIQAPIIMMSQKRQEAKDRLRSENDYRVNLKAELEIRHLHEKMDHLINRQWERLAEIQQIQLQIMQDMTRKR